MTRNQLEVRDARCRKKKDVEETWYLHSYVCYTVFEYTIHVCVSMDGLFVFVVAFAFTTFAEAQCC